MEVGTVTGELIQLTDRYSERGDFERSWGVDAVVQGSFELAFFV